MAPRRLTFAQKVRALLEQHGMSIAVLSERSGLDSSLLSKLLTETDAARREPRLEHILAIARALEITPRELADETTAEPTLTEWVPREELETESKLRASAQARIGNIETELAAARAESAAAKLELSGIARQFAELDSTTRRELASMRVLVQAAEAKLAAALAERNSAVQLATDGQVALAAARSSLLAVQRELSKTKGAASAGWLTAVIGTLGGIAVGSSTSSPKRRSGRQ